MPYTAVDNFLKHVKIIINYENHSNVKLIMRQKPKIKDYYRIGEVAKIVGVCSQTIRNYNS